MRIPRMRSERGGVLVLVAIVLPLLFVLTGAGVAGFSLYGSHRELQRAADQAALAGAAGLPPFDPNVLTDPAFPIPDTDPFLPDRLEQLVDGYVARIGDLVPDPRAIACAYGSAGLDSSSAVLASALDDPDLFEIPTDDEGEPRDTVCDDPRIYPRVETNPDNTTPVECANRLVQEVATLAGRLDPDGETLSSPIQDAVDTLVRMPLNHVLPAAFTPRMHVDVYSYLEPPLLSLVTSDNGGHLRAGATAYRRIKNAIVVPILPSQQLEIDLGLTDPVEVITEDNLNIALQASQTKLIEAVDDADGRLDELMATLGLPCQHLLHNLRQDLRDLYDPPSGPAPSALDIADAAVTAAENTAARTGISRPDPSDPDSLAGDAVLLIGVAVDEFMNPVAATQIPILDAALVVMDRAADGSYRAAVVSAANARGIFRASLVE